MSLIIDGHNLIGALPDIDLADPDDELRLLDRLRAYRARAGGRPLIVFFDSGRFPPTHATDLSSPGVQVRFSAEGQTADDAIVTYLRARGQPGQYAVVTNDQELAHRARAAGASVLRASDFVRRVTAHAPATPSAQAEMLPDPRPAAFEDIYQGFLEADKAHTRFAGARERIAPAEWIERLYGDDVGEAQKAARWLGWRGGKAALPALRDALTHSDVRVRAAAALALGDLGDLGDLGEQAAQLDLCERLAHDAGSMAREAAAQSLARIGDRAAEPALEAAARSDPKSKVRKAARAALTQIRTRREEGRR